MTIGLKESRPFALTKLGLKAFTLPGAIRLHFSLGSFKEPGGKMKHSLMRFAILVVSMGGLAPVLQAISTSGPQREAGAVAIRNFFSSPGLDFAALHDALAPLEGVKLDDPASLRDAAPLIEALREAAHSMPLQNIPNDDKREAGIAVVANKVALLNTVFEPYLGMRPDLMRLEREYRAALPNHRQEQIEARIAAIAAALGSYRDSELDSPNGPMAAALADTRRLRAVALRPASPKLLEEMKQRLAKMSAMSFDFMMFKSQARFRLDTKPVFPSSISSVVLSLFAALSGLVVPITIIGMDAGLDLMPTIAIYAVVAFSFSWGLLSNRDKFRAESLAANAAADAAELVLGIGVNVKEIPSTPEEIALARHAREFARTYKPLPFVD